MHDRPLDRPDDRAVGQTLESANVRLYHRRNVSAALGTKFT